MFRLFLIVLVVVIIAVAVWFPRFRSTMGVTLISVIAAIGLIIWQDTQERTSEFQRIQPSQASLSHMEERPGLNSRSFVVSGRLQNDAADATILGATLQATLEDCHGSDGSECEVIGQEHVDVSLEIPPAQARDFRVTIPFSSVPNIQGKGIWRYKILKVRAR